MIGQHLKHFRILDALGSGGMGEVYLAEDTRLRRRVALKVVPAETAANPGRLRRFRDEARTVAALNHPNIVTLHSVEEVGEVHFLTMELVEGRTLDELIPPNGLPAESALELAVPLADAVAAAHRNGVTHRDLKPQNVMVTTAGRVKVLDFGIAKRDRPGIAEVHDDEVTLTVSATGSITGTVPYMAPEQLQGQPASPRSDVFALGVLLYEMVTGKRPFAGESPVDVLVSILRDPPRPLGGVAGCPAALERILERCLHKDPQQRYEDAGELRQDLEELRLALVSGFSDGRLPEAYASRAAAPPAPRRRWPAAAAVVLGLGILGLALPHGDAFERAAAAVSSLEHAGDPVGGLSERKKIAVLPLEDLGPAGDEFFTAGISEELTSRLTGVSGLGVVSRSSAQRLAEGEGEDAAEPAVDYILRGTVRWSRTADGADRVRVTPQLIRVADATQVWSQRFDRVLEDNLEVQSEIAEQVLREIDPILLPPPEEASAAPGTRGAEGVAASPGRPSDELRLGGTVAG